MPASDCGTGPVMGYSEWSTHKPVKELGKTSKKKTIIYPYLVDKGFTPPPLSTAIKVSVITLRFFFKF